MMTKVDVRLDCDAGETVVRRVRAVRRARVARTVSRQPVHQFLYDSAEEYPEQGLVQLGRKYTYPELVDDVERLATAQLAGPVAEGSLVVRWAAGAYGL